MLQRLINVSQAFAPDLLSSCLVPAQKREDAVTRHEDALVHFQTHLSTIEKELKERELAYMQMNQLRNGEFNDLDNEDSTGKLAGGPTGAASKGKRSKATTGSRQKDVRALVSIPRPLG